MHPVKNVLVVTRIRFGQQIRDTEDTEIAKDMDISKRELDMGLALIDQYSEKFDVSKFKDEYNDSLLKIIEAKSKGKRATVKKMKPHKTSGTDLYDQLMESLKTKKGA
nr:hypothetical protein [Mucilaginibacter humi]